MINRIVNSYLDKLNIDGKHVDDTYIKTEFDRVSSVLNLVNLPDRVLGNLYIDVSKLPRNTKSLYDNFEDLCYSPDSTLISVEKYNICPFIVSMLVEKLYKRCLAEDVTIPIILYIDTEQLVSDLGNIIAKGKDENGRAPKIKNSLDIIYDYIYSARYVFWDRFRLDFSTYYNNYIYEILKSRYNDCLGNMYFTDKQYKNFIESVSPNTSDILNTNAGIYNLLLEQQQNKIKLIGGINSVR